MFKCDMCGECCRNLKMSEIYSALDDGTGKCIYLDDGDRPLICRIDDAYDAYFKGIMTKDEYYELNYMACDILKKSGGK